MKAIIERSISDLYPFKAMYSRLMVAVVYSIYNYGPANHTVKILLIELLICMTSFEILFSIVLWEVLYDEWWNINGRECIMRMNECSFVTIVFISLTMHK